MQVVSRANTKKTMTRNQWIAELIKLAPGCTEEQTTFRDGGASVHIRSAGGVFAARWKDESPRDVVEQASAEGMLSGAICVSDGHVMIVVGASTVEIWAPLGSTYGVVEASSFLTAILTPADWRVDSGLRPKTPSYKYRRDQLTVAADRAIRDGFAKVSDS